MDVNHALVVTVTCNVAKMYFNVIRENISLAKISEFHLKSGFDYQPGYMYHDRTKVCSICLRPHDGNLMVLFLESVITLD